MTGSSTILNKMVGAKIAAFRISRNTHQRVLAFAIGISRQQLANIESGVTGTTLDNLIKIGKYYSVPVSFLIPDDKEYSPELKKGTEEEIRVLSEKVQVIQTRIDYLKTL